MPTLDDPRACERSEEVHMILDADWFNYLVYLGLLRESVEGILSMAEATTNKEESNEQEQPARGIARTRIGRGLKNIGV